MRISDWSSDVCSSDLPAAAPLRSGKGKPSIAIAISRLPLTREKQLRLSDECGPYIPPSRRRGRPLTMNLSDWPGHPSALCPALAAPPSRSVKSLSTHFGDQHHAPFPNPFPHTPHPRGP